MFPSFTDGNQEGEGRKHPSAQGWELETSPHVDPLSFLMFGLLLPSHCHGSFIPPHSWMSRLPFTDCPGNMAPRPPVTTVSPSLPINVLSSVILTGCKEGPKLPWGSEKSFLLHNLPSLAPRRRGSPGPAGSSMVTPAPHFTQEEQTAGHATGPKRPGGSPAQAYPWPHPAPNSRGSLTPSRTRTHQAHVQRDLRMCEELQTLSKKDTP